MRYCAAFVCILVLSGGPALSSGAAAQTADTQSGGAHLEQGRTKSLQCAPCHGREGVTDNPTVPNLAGQNGRYLMEELDAFRTGSRYDGRMTPIAQSLSYQDMHDIALYFSQVSNMASNTAEERNDAQ